MKLRFRRILIDARNGIGDFVYFSPVLAALRREYKEAKITLISWWVTRELAKTCPYVDEVLILEEETDLKGKTVGDFVSGLLDRPPFGLALDFAHPPLSPLIMKVSRASKRIGFKRDDESDRVYTDLVEVRKDEPAVLQYKRFLDCIGVATEELRPEVWLSKEDKALAGKILEENSPEEGDLLIGVHPGTGVVARRWEAEKFAGLADKIVTEYRAKIILFGSDYVRTSEGEKGAVSEIEMAKEISCLMRSKPLNLAGRLSLAQFAALTSHLDLYIGLDTGPTHIASVMGAPTVAIFGPGEYKAWKPYGNSQVVRKEMDCSPCGPSGCDNPKCLKELTVDEVYGAVERLMRRRKDGREEKIC
ncbi:glycosyltransferase family 9 protein [bacterium]|nr:glycosyltransferase family 9 protein [bacterium]MBU1614759.1 glycosyltransferase family 9 protein [bacterium]